MLHSDSVTLDVQCIKMRNFATAISKIFRGIVPGPPYRRGVTAPAAPPLDLTPALRSSRAYVPERRNQKLASSYVAALLSHEICQPSVIVVRCWCRRWASFSSSPPLQFTDNKTVTTMWQISAIETPIIIHHYAYNILKWSERRAVPRRQLSFLII